MRSSLNQTWIVAACVALGLALVGRVHAQTLDAPEDPRARARALFSEGVELATARRLDEAEARFRAALALHDAPSIRYNLASVVFELRRTPEAFLLATSVAEDASTPEAVRSANASLLEQMRRVSGTVRVDASGAEGALFVDDLRLPDGVREVPVESMREHVVEVRVADRVVARATVRLEIGQVREVVLVPLDAVSIAVDARAHVPGASPVSDPASTGEPPLVEQWWFWTAVGGGGALVLIVVGAAVASSGGGNDGAAPVAGNFEPGVLRW